ncbi:MAG: ABC-2 family transporter protein [bacterium ADurb.Bin400]|nr:MAG: ABC-2 family transporter protein [bacterium ADurb.Bin400]
MHNIIAIAKNTFRETIRDKILYGILAFALLFLMSTVLFGSISLGEDIKVIKDLGLAGIYVFSLIVSIFIGTSLIYKEIEKRTLYIIFSKPVSIAQFLLGKFVGLMLSIILTVALMTATYLTVVAINGGGFDYPALWSIVLLIFELSIFVALTTLFSTFTTPLAGTLYSVIILYIGHSLEMLLRYGINSGPFASFAAKIAYYLMPNLEKFNIRNEVVYGNLPSATTISFSLIYAVLYSTILLYLANIALKNQDL